MVDAGHQETVDYPGHPAGWRIDPIAGLGAMHKGAGLYGRVGRDIVAGAGGMVVTQKFHSALGHQVERDPGDQWLARPARASRVPDPAGGRGQKTAEVRSTGRLDRAALAFRGTGAGRATESAEIPDRRKPVGRQVALRAGVQPGPLQAGKIAGFGAGGSPRAGGLHCRQTAPTEPTTS